MCRVCGLAARAALYLGDVHQRLLDVLAATGPGDFAALVAGGGTAHGVLLRGNESRPSLDYQGTPGGINSPNRTPFGVVGCRSWAPG